jgi:sucrose-6-phosphate hydrolase SacC (GH32 family)
MKKIIFFGLFCTFLACTTGNKSNDIFKDAIAVWHLSNVDDSRLKSFGDVQYVALEKMDADASGKRGGDGVAARFHNPWLDAGQGINNELNLTGKHISILVRMKADNVTGFAPLLSKAGNDQNIAYRISMNVRDGDVYIETMMGSDDIGGAHLLKYKLPKDEVNRWHDILLRFNGKISELFVDGALCDDEVTVGEIRDWNRRPALIGAQYKRPYGYANDTKDNVEAVFEGLIDHIALWNRCLSDEEVMLLSGVTAVSDGKPKYYSEKYRPQFHFSAKKNWLNDPNGLVYYNGVYHLFFQYMPPHRPGAYKDWGHAISSDLVHWEQTPNHITPHKVWAGCWSGSAVVDINNDAGFQKGDEKAIIAFITNGGNPADGIGPLCTQCIAYSTDGGTTFTYYDQNPVIRNIHNYNRDPKVVRDEVSKKWILSLYMDKGNDFGLFSSSDLKSWQHLSTVSLDGVAECPGFELLPVDGDVNNKKWLLFGAIGNYMIGSFDGVQFKPETKVMQGDYGNNYYAAMTWDNAPDGRCILIAWMPTQRYPDMPFEQQMNFPTEVRLRTTPEGLKVFKMPVPEIRNLYDKQYQWQNESIQGKIALNDLNGDLFDIDMEVDINRSSSFELGLRNVTVYYDAVKKSLSCGGDAVEPGSWAKRHRPHITHINNLGEAPLKPVDGKIKLRILLDRNSIEIFANDGEVVITSCFMPDDNNKTYSFTSKAGVTLVHAKVYSLKSAWIK